MYEGMFLLDSNRYARDARGVSGQITQLLEKFGGEVLVSRLWSEQRLAYSVKGQRKGTYWLTYFRMDGSEISKVRRESQRNNNILRTLILSVDERLADTLVQHAAANAAAAPSAPPKTDAKPAKREQRDEKAEKTEKTDQGQPTDTTEAAATTDS
jgi:small subunit ribosomal protein S6